MKTTHVKISAMRREEPKAVPPVTLEQILNLGKPPVRRPTMIGGKPCLV